MRKRHPVNKLTVFEVTRLKKPGRYADGNNLYLLIEPSGARRWILRLTVHKRRRDMGLGNAKLVPLQKAREMAIHYRAIARSGDDPFIERNKEKGLTETFQSCAESVFNIVEPGLKNKKFAKSWLSSLEKHAYPFIGEMPISQITSSDILNVLTPIWNEKSETARKIKQRMRMIIKWARAKGYFVGDDPVELAEQALPKVKRVKEHFKAVDFNDLPELLTRIKKCNVLSVSKLALEFTILTAGRTTEVINATWNEINWQKELWVIPANRMKNNQEHYVPLTTRLIEILNELKKQKTKTDFIFEGPTNKPISNNTMRLIIQKRLNVDATIHGMRSSFKDWASETTNFGNEVSEMALAHNITNKVEAAYRRGNLLQKRRELMQSWDNFLQGNEIKVIKIHNKQRVQTRMSIT